MENPIAISKVNDFIFCPVSIYFHLLDEDTNTNLYQNQYQINGKNVHRTIDEHSYSDLNNVLQGIDVFSERYNLTGKIDVFYIDKGLLVERKKKVTTIYDGYVFQVYGEYYGLTEMGYEVKSINIYSSSDNKTYPISLPSKDTENFKKFINVLNQINSFNIGLFKQTNLKKCANCIYSDLCSFNEID